MSHQGPTDETAEVDAARDIHQAVTELYEKLNAARFFFRIREDSPRTRAIFANQLGGFGVERDRTVCALVNKAANTHRAIAVLCDAALADDAYALSRVLLETAVVIAWITRGPWPERIDTFALFDTAIKRRLVKAIVDQHPGTATADRAQAIWETMEDEAAISSQVFEDRHLQWARFPDPNKPGSFKEFRIGDMLKELDSAHVGTFTGHHAYALPYFDSSQFVHSTVSSVRNVELDLAAEQSYRIAERPRHELVRLSLITSSIWMLTALNAVSEFIGGGLDVDVQALGARIKKVGQARSDALGLS